MEVIPVSLWKCSAEHSSNIIPALALQRRRQVVAAALPGRTGEPSGGASALFGRPSRQLGDAKCARRGYVAKLAALAAVAVALRGWLRNPWWMPPALLVLVVLVVLNGNNLTPFMQLRDSVWFVPALLGCAGACVLAANRAWKRRVPESHK